MAHPSKKTGLAKAQRRIMTAPERKLWSRLRAGGFHGLKFLRQAPVGTYVLDFYCSVARVAVEADGLAHAPWKDARRDAALARMGITVLRFENQVILNDIEEVLAQILTACQGHLSDSVSSS